MKTDNWWVNAGDYDDVDCEAVQETISNQQEVADEELLDTVLIALKLANQKAEGRKNDLAKAMKFPGYDGIVTRALGSGEYKWLKPSDCSSCGDLEESLLNTYEYFQRISVGVQKVLEYKEDNHRVSEIFSATKDDLRAILTEVQRALYEKNIPTEGRNVSKGIAPQEIVGEDETSRNIFNLVVYRHYLDALEEVIKGLEGQKSRIS